MKRHDPKRLFKALDLVLAENDFSPFQRSRMRAALRKQLRRGTLENLDLDPAWAWRVCAANLVLGNLDWWGWETRSEFVWDLSNKPFQYPRWDGVECALYLIAEQGIGDEIVFSNAYADLLADNPDLTVECDLRLFPAFSRTFPTLKLDDRWVDGEIGVARMSGEDRGPFDAFMPCGNALKLFRLNLKSFPGPWIVMDEDKIEEWRNWLRWHDRPWIGVSWTGRQGALPPEVFEREHGTVFNLNYDGVAHEEFVKPEFEDFDDAWHFIAALDEVHSVTNTTVHMSGAIGIPTRIIRPPPLYGDVNNRLQWQFGALCKPMYPNSTVYQSWKDYEQHERATERNAARG